MYGEIRQSHHCIDVSCSQLQLSNKSSAPVDSYLCNNYKWTFLLMLQFIMPVNGLLPRRAKGTCKQNNQLHAVKSLNY